MSTEIGADYSMAVEFNTWIGNTLNQSEVEELSKYFAKYRVLYTEETK